jgi:hypothetical protein
MTTAMNRYEAAIQMLAIADEMDEHELLGALEAFIEDGNCDKEVIESCLSNPDITDAERVFALRCLGFDEAFLMGAWALTNYRKE